MNRGPDSSSLAIVVLFAFLAVIGSRAASEPPSEDDLPRLVAVDGHPVTSLLAPDMIPAIDHPSFVAASRASFMDGDEPVLGVVLGGRARAYSLRQLDAHEIVNDELGGRAIAATW